MRTINFRKALNIKQLSKAYDDSIRYMLDKNVYGRECLFVYPPKLVECTNCIVNSSGLSSGIYKQNGPTPFNVPKVCPVCHGNGTFKEDKEDKDILIVLFDANKWFDPTKAADMPDNSAMIIGETDKTWKKIVTCDYIILNTDIYTKATPYRLKDEPQPVGLFNDGTKSGRAFYFCYVFRDGGG